MQPTAMIPPILSMRPLFPSPPINCRFTPVLIVPFEYIHIFRLSLSCTLSPAYCSSRGFIYSALPDCQSSRIFSAFSYFKLYYGPRPRCRKPSVQPCSTLRPALCSGSSSDEVTRLFQVVTLCPLTFPTFGVYVFDHHTLIHVICTVEYCILFFCVR